MTYKTYRAILAADRFRPMKSEKISELTTSRLSVYLRCLNALHSAGIKTISSQALAEQFNLNSAQIRKDLGYFGEFGVRGVGYYVDDLREYITKILGLDTPHRVGIVGAGQVIDHYLGRRLELVVDEDVVRGGELQAEVLLRQIEVDEISHGWPPRGAP